MNSNRTTKEILDKQFLFYHKNEFIDLDPISIPHLYSKRQDIEISGLLAATISWGNRKSIINNAKRLMLLMDNSPYDFIQNSSYQSIRKLNFVHRTFQKEDLHFFLYKLKDLYQQYESLESLFLPLPHEDSIMLGIERFRKVFLNHEPQSRTSKQISSPAKGSAAKRLNMFLRWMVRQNSEVDFGIWKTIPMHKLCIPLDVHSSRVARQLGIL